MRWSRFVLENSSRRHCRSLPSNTNDKSINKDRRLDFREEVMFPQISTRRQTQRHLFTLLFGIGFCASECVAMIEITPNSKKGIAHSIGSKYPRQPKREAGLNDARLADELAARPPAQAAPPLATPAPFFPAVPRSTKATRASTPPINVVSRDLLTIP